MKHRVLLIGSLLSLMVFPSSVGNSRAPWFGNGELKSEIIGSLQLPPTIKVAILHSHAPIAIGCTGPYTYVGFEKGKACGRGQKDAC